MNIYELFALVSHDYETIEKWDAETFWNDINSATGEDLANQIYFGNYNPIHDYIGYDGYANIESVSADDYEAELLGYAGEFIESAHNAGEFGEDEARELAKHFGVGVKI